MNYLMMQEDLPAWVRRFSVSDHSFEVLQQASLLPQEYWAEFVKDHIEDEGQQACVVNALFYGKAKGYV